MLKYTLITLLTFLVIPIDAADVNDLIYDSSGETVIITGCQREASGYLLIPETIEGKLVTSIGNYAFNLCSSITNITIPDSIIDIGLRAFTNCTNLTTIEVGVGNMNFTDINGILFNKKKTELVRFPEGKAVNSYDVPYGVNSIGDYAFNLCSSITNITIPDSVIDIGLRAFEKCISLAKIEVDAGNVNFTEFNGVLFNAEKTVLIAYPIGKTGANYKIPNSVIIIGNDAFSSCTSLTNIMIPDSVTNIGDGAFVNCTSLTSVEIPEGLTSIGRSTFSNCAGLKSITMPEGLTSIGVGAFNSCSSLTNITIPEGVTSIGVGAFRLCTSLTSITIPNGVTSTNGTFVGCSGLTSVEMPEGLTSIGPATFSNCTSLKSITIPEGVTSIGRGAFGLCTSLTSITIPKNVTDIGAGAFRGCKELRIINFLGDSPPVNSPVIISDSPRAAIRIKPNATGFGEVFGGLPIIDPDSITSIQSVELDTEIEQFPDGNGGIHNVKVTVKVRSDIPVEFVTKSLNGTTGTIYENEIVNQFEKGQFPDGESQPDIWIFEWKDSIPSSASKETYAYNKISVTNFDGITTEYWPDITFSNDEILPPPLTRPIEFDGNYANWEFTETNKGYGFFADEDLPYFTFKVTGDIASLGIASRDRFDHSPFEELFGDADYVESNRLQCNGNSTAFFNIGFSDTVVPKTLGFAVTDLDLEDVIVRAWNKGESIDKTTINRWFRELFDSSGNTNKPSWDPEYNAVVAQRDEDGLLSEEQFSGIALGSESASAWFFPDVPFDSLSLEYRNRLSGKSSMHVYLASKEVFNSINARVQLKSNDAIQISFPIETGENYFIEQSVDLKQWNIIEENITSDSEWVTGPNFIFSKDYPIDVKHQFFKILKQ